LVAAGARRATSPRDAAEAEVVMMTMLADDGAPESVVYGKDGVLGGSALHALHSTIGIAVANRLATDHAAHSGFVSAPVFGRVIAAEAADEIDRCTPLFEAIGQ
jgi:3-hydroxyisobutyrate dehydrogenase-like beta-hydroxyacid dehydrogenase